MGKRSDFPRLPQDNYDTPAEAVAPLIAQLLKPHARFIEPCAGNGQLIEHLKRAGHVLVGAFDLPDDARVKRYAIEAEVVFVTNPPWRRGVLHEVIVNLSDQAPAWLLIDADWVHTLQSIPHLPRLRTIVSVGRVRWIPTRHSPARTIVAGICSTTRSLTP